MSLLNMQGADHESFYRKRVFSSLFRKNAKIATYRANIVITLEQIGNCDSRILSSKHLQSHLIEFGIDTDKTSYFLCCCDQMFPMADRS